MTWNVNNLYKGLVTRFENFAQNSHNEELMRKVIKNSVQTGQELKKWETNL